MENLSKEQLLLLQDNLSYSVYEQFMGMFPKYEVLPMDSESFCEKIVSMMKEHDYWGEIAGWGENRKYIRIHNNKDIIIKQFSYYMGLSSEEFVSWMDTYTESWDDKFSSENQLAVED